MIDLISKGGPLVWLLIGCLCFAGAIFVERLAYFRGCSSHLNDGLDRSRPMSKPPNMKHGMQKSP